MDRFIFLLIVVVWEDTKPLNFYFMIFIARFYLQNNQQFLRNERIIPLPTYLYLLWDALSLYLMRINTTLFISVGRPILSFNR